jgi:RHS repeat-associated protein
MAGANPFRFSTKFQDVETDLLYYGYRYYSASTGRWLGQDPVNELGFCLLSNVTGGDQPSVAADGNSYAFVANNTITQIDPFGLAFYAIDGTWTDARAISNPWLLSRWTKETPSRYYRGPKDGPTGSDTLKISFNVLRDVCKDYCSAGGKDFTVNLTGWSRGAVAAVTVADMLRAYGCDCGCGSRKPIPVNWIGLFDAVKMSPSPLTTSIPSNVAHVHHAVKTSTSYKFPTLHYAGAVEHKVYNYKQPYESTHGDVGISLANTSLALFWKNDAYHWIENSAIASGVKF